MTRRKTQVCAQPGCPNLRPCEVEGHERKAWEGSNRKGSSRRGRKVRARILERDPICTICGKNPSSVCDHVWQVAHGAPENYADVPEELLRGICVPCDRRLSAKQGAEGRREVGGDA